MSAPLLEMLRALANERADKVAIDEAVKSARATFEAEHQALLFAHRLAGETIAKLELAVRVLGAEVYLNTADKHPAPGVEVKLFKTMEIADKAAALVWAKQTNIGLVPETIDTKAVLKVASMSPLPFVLYGEEARVTIATQLPAAELVEVAS